MRTSTGGDSVTPKQPGGFLRLVLLIARAVRLRCPACGRGKIFRGFFTMHEACPHCGRPFQRGPGFFLGSIYFNYGVTGLLVTLIYFACFFTEILTDRQLLVLTLAFALLFPIWFFRYARALWVAFDELWDPATAPLAATDKNLIDNNNRSK